MTETDLPPFCLSHYSNHRLLRFRHLVDCLRAVLVHIIFRLSLDSRDANLLRYLCSEIISETIAKEEDVTYRNAVSVSYILYLKGHIILAHSLKPGGELSFFKGNLGDKQFTYWKWTRRWKLPTRAHSAALPKHAITTPQECHPRLQLQELRTSVLSSADLRRRK